MKKILFSTLLFFLFLENVNGALDNYAPTHIYSAASGGDTDDVFVYFSEISNRQLSSGLNSNSEFVDIYSLLVGSSNAKLVNDFNYLYNNATGLYFPAFSGAYLFQDITNFGYIEYGTSYETPLEVFGDKIKKGNEYYCFFYDYTNRATNGRNVFIPWKLGFECLDSFVYSGNTWHSLAINFGTPPPEPTPPPPPTPPPQIPGVSCKLIEVPTLSSTVWWDDFFENTFSAVGSGTVYNQDGTVKSQVKFAESANADFSDYDRFTASDVQAISSLYTGSLTYPGTIKSNLSPGAGANGGLYIANFTSDRNGTRRPWNVLQIFGADTGFFGNFGYLQDFQTRDTTELEYDGSGTVTYLSPTPVRDFAIQAVGGFNGLRIGLAAKSTYYECSGSNGNFCQLNAIATGSGVECRGQTSPQGIEYGQCEWKGTNICAPITQSGVVVAPLPLQGQAYTIDGSGAVTYSPYYIPGADIDTNGLFDCTYSDWTDSVGCIKEILGNISDSISKGNDSLVGGNNAINQTIQSVGKNQTGSLDISLVSATGANLIDDIFRGSWNQAMGGTDFFGELGRFALYGALLCLVVLIILLIISANKK